MKRRKLTTLIALLVLLAVLLQGCMFPELYGLSGKDESPATPPTEPTAPDNDPTEPTETTQAAQRPPYVPYDRYERLVPSPEEARSFGDIEYTRPDAQHLRDGFAEVQSLVDGGADSGTILEAYYPVEDEYVTYSTMAQYAYIRYTIDLDDEFFTAENAWCDEQSPLVEQAAERCFLAMAESDQRGALEWEYFGDGFFDYYERFPVYSNDRVVELMQKEAALQTDYMALQSSVTVTWENEERLVSELLDDPELDYDQMMTVYRLYYRKYAPQAAKIYASLVKVRREIAQELGYDSYAEFAYAYYYDRDYTPEQAQLYTADIAREMADLFYPALMNDYDEEMEASEVMELLGETAYGFGGAFATAYEFMLAYDLYDISSSPSKMPGSYMTYLPTYGMPFMYVSPTDGVGDFLTATHEFGHFVDGFVNCNQTSSIDCAEIFSQGLEFLALDRAPLDSRTHRSLTKSKLADSVMTFLSQACYAEFERQVYELPDGKITADNLSRIFYDCNERFGMGAEGMEDVIGPGWIDVQHFFIAPFYVISYCVSNDAALQIYMAELETGDGSGVYQELLDNAAGNTVLALLDEAGLESPFAKGRVAELAAFFAEELR